MARGGAKAAAGGAVEGPWGLPEGWRWERLGDVLPLAYGNALRAADRSEHGTIPVYGSAGITGYHNTALCNEPSVIVGRKGSAGSVFYENSPSFAIDTAYYCSKSKSKMDLKLAFHLLTHLNLRKLDQSTAIPSLSRDIYNEIVVPVAREEMQMQLAGRIDELFAEVDDGEAALARARGDLATWRKALLKAAVTGELTADWRAANPPSETGAALLARILAKRRARWLAEPRNKGKEYVEPAKLDTTSFRSLPEGWTWATLGQLCSIITSGSRAWSSYYGRGKGTFVMAQNIRPGRYDDRFQQRVDPPEGDIERVRTAVARDDLLLTIVGANTGDLCQFDRDPNHHYVCQSVALLRLQDCSLSRIAEAFFANDFGRKLQMEEMIYGAGRPHLSFDQIKLLVIPVQPIAEREQITLTLQVVMSEVNDVIGDIPDPKILSTTLRQAILAAAFRGELVA